MAKYLQKLENLGAIVMLLKCKITTWQLDERKRKV
jgi:hypothetical protein